MLLAALLLAAQPAPRPQAAASVQATARILTPVRVQAGRVETNGVTQRRVRPGLVLVEFQ